MYASSTSATSVAVSCPAGTYAIGGGGSAGGAGNYLYASYPIDAGGKDTDGGLATGWRVTYLSAGGSTFPDTVYAICSP